MSRYRRAKIERSVLVGLLCARKSLTRRQRLLLSLCPQHENECQHAGYENVCLPRSDKYIPESCEPVSGEHLNGFLRKPYDECDNHEPRSRASPSSPASPSPNCCQPRGRVSTKNE